MIDDPLNRIYVVRGMNHPNAKLTDDDVRMIRELIAQREEFKQQAKQLSNANLAAKFSVHQRTIERISQQFGWIHID